MITDLIHLLAQLRHFIVPRGAAAESVHPEDQRVWRRFKQQPTR